MTRHIACSEAVLAVASCSGDEQMQVSSCWGMSKCRWRAVADVEMFMPSPLVKNKTILQTYEMTSVDFCFNAPQKDPTVVPF